VAVRVAQVDRLEVLALHHLGAGDAAPAQVVAPAGQLLLGLHGEREVVGRPAPHRPLLQLRILEAGHERAGAALLVAEQQVARPAVVLVHRPLDQPHAEQAAVELDRPLHVLADQRHVVQAGEARPVLVQRKPSPPERRLNSSRIA
jgi:hypothetical protein